MSAEAEFLDGASPPKHGRRCRYCARLLTAFPSEPDQAGPHCVGAGCRWCSECATGQTSVSPVRNEVA